MTTKTKTNPLESIAANMRSHIVTAGAQYSHQRLPRGLELVLQRRTEQAGQTRWRLALGRPDVTPSDEEIAICRRSFGVPDATDHTTKRVERVSKKTGIVSNWYVVEMYWTEK